MVCNRYMSERNVHPQYQNDFKRLMHLDKIDKVEKKEKDKKLMNLEFMNLKNTNQN